jgi:hypothetical protein
LHSDVSQGILHNELLVGRNIVQRFLKW